jgi:energy-converting hydrogenase Eha subunit E
MQLRWLFTFAAMLWMLCVAAAWAKTREPIVHALDVQVPIAPVSVPIAGRNHLVYELHLTNFAAADAVLTHVDVLDAASGRTLAEYRRADLATIIEHVGPKREGDNEVLEAGRRAVLFMWLTVDSSAPLPAAIEHRAGFDLRTAAPISAVVRAGTTRLANEAVTVLRSPLRGGPWVALYDPSMARGHRRFVYAVVRF